MLPAEAVGSEFVDSGVQNCILADTKPVDQVRLCKQSTDYVTAAPPPNVLHQLTSCMQSVIVDSSHSPA